MYTCRKTHRKGTNETKTVLSEHQILSNWLNLLYGVLRIAVVTQAFCQPLDATKRELFFACAHSQSFSLALSFSQLRITPYSLRHRLTGCSFRTFSMQNFISWGSLSLHFLLFCVLGSSLVLGFALISIAHMCNCSDRSFKSALVFLLWFIRSLVRQTWNLLFLPHTHSCTHTNTDADAHTSEFHSHRFGIPRVYVSQTEFALTHVHSTFNALSLSLTLFMAQSVHLHSHIHTCDVRWNFGNTRVYHGKSVECTHTFKCAHPGCFFFYRCPFMCIRFGCCVRVFFVHWQW